MEEDRARYPWNTRETVIEFPSRNVRKPVIVITSVRHSVLHRSSVIARITEKKKIKVFSIRFSVSVTVPPILNVLLTFPSRPDTAGTKQWMQEEYSWNVR